MNGPVRGDNVKKDGENRSRVKKASMPKKNFKPANRGYQGKRTKMK